MSFNLSKKQFIAPIFKAYDIRGIYPSELNEDIAYKIGAAFIIVLGIEKVVIGYDGRDSSINLFKALSQGIIDQGADVISIGLSSTPMLYFASQNIDAAIIVTASHLPKEYNGFKLCQNGLPISEEEIKKIKIFIEKNKALDRAIVKRKGKIIKKEILPTFIENNLKFIRPHQKRLKIVLDAGNGMSGYTLPKIFEKIKSIDLIEQYTNIDFTFPNHEANPLNFETLKDIQKRVQEENADFGVATDADGDRSVFIDEKGEIISPDLIIALIGRYFLKENKGLKIMFDVRCSKIVRETIEENGGVAILSRVGHSFIKRKMKKEDIFFAGELSGHFYYKENNYAESPFMTTIFIANILANSSQRLSELIKPFQKYYFSGEINFKVKDKDKKSLEIENFFKKNALKIEKLDGLSVYFKDWWFNIRKSNTENLLRLNLEADTKELMEENSNQLSKTILD